MTMHMRSAARIASTALSTMPPGAARSTGTPPSQRRKAPNGPRNSVCLAMKRARRPRASLANTPITKSQLEVWGATISTLRGTSGNSPRKRNPKSAIPRRPTAREKALPRLGTFGPRTGTAGTACILSVALTALGRRVEFRPSRGQSSANEVSSMVDEKDAAAKPEAEGVSRRGFMKWSLPVGWVAFSGAAASSLVATARFLFPNVLFEPPQSFKAGFPSEYNVGEVDVRWKDAFGVWIVREPDQFYAIIAVCTHLGCSPNWLAAENKFKCPCHGSGFYMSGMNFEGPAPRPLARARKVGRA